MNPLLAAAGAVVVAATVLDVLWTTLWPDGEGGPIANAVTTPSYLLVRRLARHHTRAMTVSGPLALVASVLAWVVLLWAGWVLLFSADPDSVVDVSGGGVSLAGRIYFVGYTMFTMGNGDFSPADDVWQILTAVATASGMLIVTLVVTYLLSVVRAVADKRAFASSVSGLGRTAQEIVVNGWDRRDLRSLDLSFQDLASRLSSIADQHNTFPVLHHFHASQRRQAPTVAVATLDEALTVIQHGTTAPAPSQPVVTSLRSSIDDYLATVSSTFVVDRDTPPPAGLDRLRAGGVPTVDDADWRAAVDELDTRRRQLRGIVEGDGWAWDPDDQR